MQTTFENSKPDISCIYVNYRSAKFLERSLESLFQYEQDTSYEVIIVNNDQNEQGELENIQKKFGVRIIPSFHNPGFGTAANVGAAQAEGKLLFFVNPDTKWIEPLFKETLGKFRDTKDLGVVGIQLVSPEGEREEQQKENSFQFPLYPTRKKNAWVSGGAFFIMKELFIKMEGFDERFFMYFEDMDLCVRIQQAGYHIFLDSNHQLIHYGGKSHFNKKSQKKLYDHSLYQYTKKHWSLWEYSFFRVMHPLYRFLFPYGRN